MHPIFNAIITRNRPLLLSLLSTSPACVAILDVDTGLTPLICATCAADQTAVKILLDYGAPVNIPSTRCGWTALMYAVYYHFLNIIKLLLDKGADQTVEGAIDGALQMGKGGRIGKRVTISVRDLALMHGHIDIVQMLDNYRDKQNTDDISKPVTKPTVSRLSLRRMMGNYVNNNRY